MMDFVSVKLDVKRLILNEKRKGMGTKKSPDWGLFDKYLYNVNQGKKNYYSADTSNSTSVE